MRVVEKRLKEIAYTQPPRGDMVAIHGNRLVLHCVFMDHKVKGYRSNSIDFGELKEYVRVRVEHVFVALTDDVEMNYENSYLATLFKNLQKCRDINERLLKKLYPSKKTSVVDSPVRVPQKTLFPDND